MTEESGLKAALDEISSLKLGENMNLEYGWSENMEELISQFYFQLTRTSNSDTLKMLENMYWKLLNKIFLYYENSKDLKYIIIINKIIAHTRDIIAGKGEYNLTYMLISGLYKFGQSSDYSDKYKYQILAMTKNLVYSLIRLDNSQHPFGSWKDMKYLCNYIIPDEAERCVFFPSRNSIKRENELFNYIIIMMIDQLRSDVSSGNPSLLAKWIPREKSKKFGWITVILATEYYKDWIPDPCQDKTTDKQISLAKRKCLTHFRQLVSGINKKLKTVQINQCNGTWNQIDFNKNVTSITFRKQSKAFLNNNKKGMKYPMEQNSDRVECRENYYRYIENCKTGKCQAKGKRVSIIDFVRDAINLQNSQCEELEKDILNEQWRDNLLDNLELQNCIAMVDTSHSMTSDNMVPLYSAIGLGIKIAEKSKFGKRVLTFSGVPSWINLDECTDFVSMVYKVHQAPWGTNTNFRAALDLILKTAVYKNISPCDMEKMILIILSDMQIDYGMDKTDNNMMFEMMKERYRSAGMETVYKQPYPLPHIIFWNLRPTHGFPVLASQMNTSMMSGNNSVLLNNFCQNGSNSLKMMTPWNILINTLLDSRYYNLEKMTIDLFRQGQRSA